MTKKVLFIWIFLLIFGFSSMPDISFANTSKHPGKTELTKKKSPRKHRKSRKSSKKKKSSKRKSKGSKYKKHSKKRGSKKRRGAGKKKYSKRHSKRYSKRYSKKHSKGKRHGKRRNRRSRTTHLRRTYTPPTNNGSVEYRNYKRNSDADNQSNENIDKIAPQKEIKKEPKKEGE